MEEQTYDDGINRLAVLDGSKTANVEVDESADSRGPKCSGRDCCRIE